MGGCEVVVKGEAVKRGGFCRCILGRAMVAT